MARTKSKTITNKSDLFEIAKSKTKEVPVGSKLLPLRKMSTTDRLSMNGFLKEHRNDSTAVEAYVVISCCDLLSMDDLETVKRWDPDILKNVCDEASILSGLLDGAEAETGKKSERTPT